MTMYGMKRRDVKPVRSSRKPLCSDAVTVESDSEPHVNWSSRPVHLHNKPVLEEVAVGLQHRTVDSSTAMQLC